jgi:L-threonylcarbamoyladenylate synthase
MVKMKTALLHSTDIDQAAHILLKGGVLAVPTDTVYGLAVCFNDMHAIHKLRMVKHRPEDKAFALMVSSLDMIESMADLTERDRAIIHNCLPGDLTLILNKKKSFDAQYFKDLSTIAFRIPDEKFILDLIKTIQTGLLVPSANKSGENPCVDSDCVYEVFKGEIEGIIVGQSGQKEASTIVDATQKTLVVVRQGRMTLEEIKKKARIDE